MADEEKLTPKETLQGCLGVIVIMVVVVFVIGVGVKACSSGGSDGNLNNAAANSVADSSISGGDTTPANTDTHTNIIKAEQQALINALNQTKTEDDSCRKGFAQVLNAVANVDAGGPAADGIVKVRDAEAGCASSTLLFQDADNEDDSFRDALSDVRHACGGMLLAKKAMMENVEKLIESPNDPTVQADGTEASRTSTASEKDCQTQFTLTADTINATLPPFDFGP